MRDRLGFRGAGTAWLGWRFDDRLGRCNSRLGCLGAACTFRRGLGHDLRCNHDRRLGDGLGFARTLGGRGFGGDSDRLRRCGGLRHDSGLARTARRFRFGDLGDRLKAAMVKSLREGRERSDWGVSNTAYEGQMENFIDNALAHTAAIQEFLRAREPLAAIGRRKAVVQLVLKLTIPGVPDIYRGAEDWEQSFVDPDNRRPLDFAALARRLDHPEAVVNEKLVLTGTLLQLRRARPALFARGRYEPLDRGANVLAFRRLHEDDEMVVMANLSPHDDLTAGETFAGEGWQSHLPPGPAAVLTKKL